MLLGRKVKAVMVNRYNGSNRCKRGEMIGQYGIYIHIYIYNTLDKE